MWYGSVSSEYDGFVEGRVLHVVCKWVGRVGVGWCMLPTIQGKVG